MKDFVAVLNKFRELGRYGLSQQALSEICGRAISVSELRNNPEIRLTFCAQVKTPVYGIWRGGFFIPPPGPEDVLYWLAIHLEKEFPWPKFKGMSKLVGQKSTGLRPSTLATLRRAIPKARTQ